MAAEQPQLRATFNAVAELYDRVRPTYPSRLITDLVCLYLLTPSISLWPARRFTGSTPRSESLNPPRRCGPEARWPPSPPVTSPVEPLTFREVQTCYRRWDPSTSADLQLLTPNNIEFDRETDGFNEFEPAIFRRYEQEIEYSTSTYAETLRTYSATQALPPSVREGLLDCITTLINQRYDGIVVKRYLFELRVTRRRS